MDFRPENRKCTDGYVNASKYIYNWIITLANEIDMSRRKVAYGNLIFEQMRPRKDYETDIIRREKSDPP